MVSLRSFRFTRVHFPFDLVALDSSCTSAVFAVCCFAVGSFKTPHTTHVPDYADHILHIVKQKILSLHSKRYIFQIIASANYIF